MKRKRDPLQVPPNWHVDLRIADELPEDNLVGTRFIINLVFSAVALAAALYAGWLGYVNVSLRYQIHDWDRRMDDSRAEVREIQRMQGEYAKEAAKIDQAHALVRPTFFVSGFIADIARTRPDPMTIDVIEWNDAGVVVRGSLTESSERASRLLGSYVDQLRADPAIGALFREIVLTDLNRGATGAALRFEINFRLKPDPA